MPPSTDSISALSLFGIEGSRLMMLGTRTLSDDHRKFLSFRIIFGGLNIGRVLQQSIIDLLHRIIYSLDTKIRTGCLKYKLQESEMLTIFDR